LKKDEQVGSIETLLAGFSLAHNFTLATSNTKEFEKANGIKLENWF